MLTEDELKKIRKNFNDKKEKFFTNAFRALGDSNRHRIFQVLINQPKMSASDIADTLKISRPLTSQHLKILEQNQLCTKQKVGQMKYYQLARKNSLVNLLIEMIYRAQ